MKNEDNFEKLTVSYFNTLLADRSFVLSSDPNIATDARKEIARYSLKLFEEKFNIIKKELS